MTDLDGATADDYVVEWLAGERASLRLMLSYALEIMLTFISVLHCRMGYIPGVLNQQEDMDEHIGDIEEMLCSMCPSFGDLSTEMRVEKLLDVISKVSPMTLHVHGP